MATTNSTEPPAINSSSQNAVYNLFGDHLPPYASLQGWFAGSTTVVWNSDGSAQAVEKYKAFGEWRYPTDSLGFGLYHFGARVYDLICRYRK